jgi:hypothetical protein
MDSMIRFKSSSLVYIFAFTCPHQKAGDVVGKADGTERVFDNEGVVFARAGISIKVVRKN